MQLCYLWNHWGGLEYARSCQSDTEHSVLCGVSGVQWCVVCPGDSSGGWCVRVSPGVCGVSGVQWCVVCPGESQSVRSLVVLVALGVLQLFLIALLFPVSDGTTDGAEEDTVDVSQQLPIPFPL